jgi:pyruvate,orthophosphate dikinase
LQIACDLVEEELIDPATAVQRLRNLDLDSISRVRLAAEDAAVPLAEGMPAGTGVTAGRVALSVDAARHYAEQGDPVVLVRDEASTADIAGLAVCRGLVTGTGARTSHAAVVARQLDVVCVVGCRGLLLDTNRGQLRVGSHQLDEGDMVTVDGGRGVVYEGQLDLRLERPGELIERVQRWQGARTPGSEERSRT